MKRALLWTVVLLTSSTVGFLYYIGFFMNLEVKEGMEGGYLLGGFYHMGPYEEVGETFMKAKAAADSLGFPTDTLIGCYFDDPNTVAADSLQSFIGAVVASGDFSYVGNIDPGHLEIHAIFEGEALYVDFPYKNDLSMIVGAIRVYPFLTKEAEKRGFETGQVYEIYTENTIRYVFQTYPVAQEASDSFWELVEETGDLGE
ncbi:MAG TPA: hypothetical protein DCE58_06580 [Cryomorphaceae bacterium]|nr:hypothetical protein [Cryomorphaceae bacterium]